MADSCDTEVDEYRIHIDSDSNSTAPVISADLQTIQKPVGRRSNCWNAFVFIDETDVDPKLRKAQCVHRKKATYLAFEKKFKKIRDVLEPFCDITELFSGNDYPTANLYFENVWRIAMHLRELATSEDNDLRDMGIRMKDKFEKYWLKSDVYDVQEYNTLFAFALVLDPRYKVQCLKLCFEKLYNDQDALIEVGNVKFKLEKLFLEYMPKGSNNSTEASSSAPNQRTSKRPKFNIADLDTRDSSDVAIKTKLDLYLEEPRLDRHANFNILEFWGKNEPKYGELSSMARDILSVPLTTVASESTFSIGGRILNKWRSSYLPENVEILITARSWLYGYEAMEEECIGSEVDWTAKRRV